jgi:hypothetical protein
VSAVVFSPTPTINATSNQFFSDPMKAAYHYA